VSGVSKTRAEAQAIVDGKVEEEQAAYDALSTEKKEIKISSRPQKYYLP
jgi:hypothetical protein